MKLLKKAKDGGPESPVDAYFLLEIKSLFSIALLKFNKGGREAYHNHAFHASTWFLKGELLEEDLDGSTYRYARSIIPKVTKRSKFHRVKAFSDSWCLTVRGPWLNYWQEYSTATEEFTTLTHGRKVVSVS
jgi:hypothetical protein